MLSILEGSCIGGLRSESARMKKQDKPRFKQGEKVLFIMAGVFLLLATIGFIAMQIIGSKSDKPLFTVKTHYHFNAEGKRGSTLFRKQGCTICHRALNEGTNMGRTANLDGIGSRYSVEWLYNFLRTPRKMYNETLFDHTPGQDAGFVEKMPAKDLHAIATFLSQLKADQGSTTSYVPPKGESPFIDSMVKTWAPKEWKLKYHDIRDNYTSAAKPQGDK